MIRFLRDRVRVLGSTNTASSVEKMTLRLTQELLNLEDDHAPDLQWLETKISKVIDIVDFISAAKLEDCLDCVREKHGLNGQFLLNEEGNSIRAVSDRGEHFVSVMIFSPSRSVAFGVLVAKTDIFENEVIEMTLRVLGALHLARSIERQAREDRAEHERRLALSTLASQVAHDIRSPLSALTMLSSVATELPDEKRTLMRQATQRISDIANSLLNSYRDEDGAQARAEVQFRTLSVSALVDSIVSEKRLQISSASGIRIEIPKDYPREVFVSAHEADSKRVLSNVLNNAIEALNGSGIVTVEISVNETGGAGKSSVEIIVKDNGCGIPQHVLRHLGEVPLSYGKSSETQGFGLGLPHAFSVMKSLGGRISIKSAVSVGTEVKLVFPRAVSLVSISNET